MKAIHLILAALIGWPSIGLTETPTKLYWFIPDGMRADPEEFKVYEWAKEGTLPNIKKLIEEGSFGYSIPDFPSHTPVNFATLLTGSHPEVHGIADGPMHIEGKPLVKPSAPGFSSVTKRVAPIWTVMEKDHGKNVFLLSIPGSTPPELKKGTTIRGRWGGWGADNHSVIFEPESKLAGRKEIGKGTRLFFLGEQLTRFVKTGPAADWQATVTSKKTPIEAKLEAQGLGLYALVTGDKAYDQVAFSFDKKTVLTTLKAGQWSDWYPVTLKFKDSEYTSNIKLKVIALWKNGDFRIRVLINNLNRFITQPPEAAEVLTAAVGPMVDFADNWPPQLVYEAADKETFLEEARMSLDWHRRAVPVVFDKFKPDVFIHDIYTPNLMLESRWWYREIDKTRKSFKQANSESAWKDLKELYIGLDSIIGEAMKKADKNTLIALSSDHGVCQLKRLVKLNNFFAKKGWLKYSIDPKTGEASIDWPNTKVVYLKMMNIFVHPNGLGGDWKRGSGPEYEKLREEVIKALESLKDGGEKPVVRVVKSEDAKQVYQLPQDRLGDLVIEAKLNYFWHEEVDASGKVFADSNTSGYKQSINPRENKCMWTPFVVWGPGVKKGFQLTEPIGHADQLPTFLKLMKKKIPEYVQGKPIDAIIQ